MAPEIEQREEEKIDEEPSVTMEYILSLLDVIKKREFPAAADAFAIFRKLYVYKLNISNSPLNEDGLLVKIFATRAEAETAISTMEAPPPGCFYVIQTQWTIDCWGNDVMPRIEWSSPIYNANNVNHVSWRGELITRPRVNLCHPECRLYGNLVCRNHDNQ